MPVFPPIEARPAPRGQTGFVKWLRDNLFSNWFNSALTILCLYFLYITIPPLVSWAILDAAVSGNSRAACDAVDGACWTFVIYYLDFFLYGRFPEAERWRVDVFFMLFVIAFAPQFFERAPFRKPLAIFGLTGLPVIGGVLLLGGVAGLPSVDTEEFGGLMLTLVIAYVGIVASLPLGVLLALGRQSKLPLIRAMCVAFIELWRGVPLITILFMSSVMLPLFLPEELTLDKLLRALIGIVLFEAALIAEVVRGGLQALPKGQYEAANALGLSYWKSMRLIIMPQALKNVIPGIVNVFTQLTKDTTLVLIIGLFDVLQTVRSSIQDPAWPIVRYEGFAFAALCFFVICYGLSVYSRSLEAKLDTSHKKS